MIMNRQKQILDVK